MSKQSPQFLDCYCVFINQHGYVVSDRIECKLVLDKTNWDLNLTIDKPLSFSPLRGDTLHAEIKRVSDGVMIVRFKEFVVSDQETINIFGDKLDKVLGVNL